GSAAEEISHMTRYKNLTTKELIEAAYKEQNDDDFWEMIVDLHCRGSDTELHASLDLIKSDDPISRQIGAQIISQLDPGKQTYHEQAIKALIPLLEDKNEDVIEVAAFGLGHRQDKRNISHLLKVVDHPNANIRHGVVMGLSRIEDPAAISGLIKLSADSDYDTRNWATFGLGSQCDMDTPEIRKALRERLSDEDPEIRGEALIGLAKRKDSQVKQAIIKELTSEFLGSLAIEAAGVLADPDFIPLLEELKRVEKDNLPKSMLRDIEEALESCSKNP
ncbi:MAG: HEAT repeat domain-containing protein, partial [Alphaproteobacteria bacterium]|nr:HEAT repeat domain-containing protein [Alphaproteobacteria bacterium]